ncbi:MAG: hypothetical protein ACRCXT_05100 [Paraclostridium sp.]
MLNSLSSLKAVVISCLNALDLALAAPGLVRFNICVKGPPLLEKSHISIVHKRPIGNVISIKGILSTILAL